MKNLLCCSQGPVLRHWLLLLYINDFHLCSDFFQFHLFADNANLFCEGKKLSTLIANINAELIKVHQWLRANKLSLNIEKSMLHFIQGKNN